MSLADARLLALRSLRAAAATSARGPASAQPKAAAAAAAAADAAAALGACLAPLLDDAAAGEDPGAGTAVGWLRMRLALAAEVAEARRYHRSGTMGMCCNALSSCEWRH